MNAEKLIAIGKPRKNFLGFRLVKVVKLDLSHPKTLAEIQQLVRMNCFVVLIPEDESQLPDPLELVDNDMDLPAGQIFSVGHEDPEFMTVVEFLTRIDYMDVHDKELRFVGEQMRDNAYLAEECNLNHAFTSRCSYTFFGSELTPEADVVAVGVDEIGFYLKTISDTYKYALSPLVEEEI